MLRRCAWCGRDLGTVAGSRPTDDRVTHGICPDCRSRLETGTGIPIEEFLASLDAPVLLIDADHTVGMVNSAAEALLDGNGKRMVGERAGTVFECENSHLPGGCSLTVHCSGCTIRQAVAFTHHTGEPKLNVPATLRVVDDADLADVDLLISTARVGNRVLLKVDRYQKD
jgi:hypothetical protein